MPDLASNRLAASLVVQRQREEMNAIGEQVETPVIYLKAAWADAALYGGRGERQGTDIDLLVSPSRFEAFSEALCAAGYKRSRIPQFRAILEDAHERSFAPPAGRITVDLHRSLGAEPWFVVDIEAYIGRAVSYPTSQGEILSLCPDDQVVFAAIHYANHRFNWNGRHFEDTVLLLDRTRVDWRAVHRRANRAGADVPMAILIEALQNRGAEVPPVVASGGMLSALRLKWARWFISTSNGIGRRRHWPSKAEMVALLPALSSRHTALPRFMLAYVRARTLELVRFVGGQGQK